jgi:hypothetical protein
MSDQQAKFKGVVDIVFLIDVTGSMAHCIDALKGNIKAFVKTMVEGAGGPNDSGPVVKDFRIKVVGFRDVNCDREWFVESPFTSSVDEAHSRISALVAEGGGDEPESLLDALHKVCSMGQTERGVPPDPARWRYRREARRVVVIFTDASFHPVMAYPEGRGGDVHDVVNVANQQKIMVECFVPDVACYDDSISRIDGANAHKIPFDPSDEKGAVIALENFTRDKANFAKVMQALAKTVSKSTEVELL